MAKKGREKNTLNKAKHSKLVNRKKNKLRKEKELRVERLKAIVQKVNQSKEKDSHNE
ncbi:hypothetical protein SAMN04487910_0516 [Aquimarina amphilecti]|uniref:Uncharacterized protein n=1 Tax=Aquimarina amphilecti TaxID=1038014 RepID=A0A1H7H5B8_AQUAM|nr:hypothetical protein [Aquimarina amphilecti]SEK43305.1 hypothetical protein SAMN04487910_0516 [Aquimarina amphilecti]